MQAVSDTERAVFLHKARRAVARIRSAPGTNVDYEDYTFRCYVRADCSPDRTLVEITLVQLFFAGNKEQLGIAIEVTEEDQCLESCVWLVETRDKALPAKDFFRTWHTHFDRCKALADVEQLLDLIEAGSK
jgi:hypothetical protein